VGEKIRVVGRLLHVVVFVNILKQGFVPFIYIFFSTLDSNFGLRHYTTAIRLVLSIIMLISNFPLAADADGRHVAGQFRGVVARWGV
jgi:hypothetical protein